MGEFLRNLLDATPLLAGFALIWWANAPKVRRQQHYPLPVVALLYAVAALVLLYKSNLWYDKLLDLIFGWLPFLESWYQVSWQYAIQNGLLLTGFAGLKLLLRSLVLSRFFVGESFPGSRIVSEFYEYDDQTGQWYIRPRFALLRTFLLVGFAVSLSLAVLIVALARTYPTWPMFQAIPYPAIPVLVLGECYFALAGQTKQEAGDDIYGEKDAAERKADYSSLRRVYREQFGERILDDGSRLSGPHLVSSFDSVQSLLKSPHGEVAAAGAYFKHLQERKHELDPNYMKVAVGLIEGRSSLVHNPFHHDLTDYLAFAAYVRLLQGDACLVIAGRAGAEAELTEWMRDGIDAISGVGGLWDIDVLGARASDELEVGVLRGADLHSLDLLRTHAAFFARVALILVVEPSRILATGQLGLRLVSESCRIGPRPAVVALDGNHDGLVDALSQLFEVEIKDVFAAPASRGSSSTMVWDADGRTLRSRYLPTISRQLGVGMEIGAVALKYHVSEVDWVGGRSVPVHDLLWIGGQYFQDLTAFAELESSQLAIQDPIVASANPAGLRQRLNRFIVAEDENSNVYEALRLLSTRATQNGFVHVVADDYLLRDYMVGNKAIFQSDPKAVPSIVPDFAQTERALTFRLVAKLELAPMAETELRRELQSVGVGVGDEQGHRDGAEPAVLRELRSLIHRHTGVGDVVFSSELRFEDPLAEEGVRHFGIPRGGRLDDVLRSLRSAYFVVEDSEDERDFIGACLYGHVHQTLLPGQFVTYVGKYYEVTRIASTPEGDRVLLRRAADHVRRRRHYRPLLTLEVTDVEPGYDDSEPRRISAITVERLRGNLVVASEGYTTSDQRSRVGVERVELPSPVLRRHVNKDFLRLSMPGAPAGVRRSIAVLMNELFVTLFPHAHPFIWAVTEDRDGQFADVLPRWRDPFDDDSILLVEDSMVDLGLIVAMERNLTRILEMVTDFVGWESERRHALLQAAQEPDREFVAFPGETAEEVAARRAVAEAQDSGRPAVRREGALRRLWRAIAGFFGRLFRRRRGRGEAATGAGADGVPTPALIPDQPIDGPGAEPATGIVPSLTGEEEGEPRPSQDPEPGSETGLEPEPELVREWLPEEEGADTTDRPTATDPDLSWSAAGSPGSGVTLVAPQDHDVPEPQAGAPVVEPDADGEDVDRTDGDGEATERTGLAGGMSGDD